MKAILKDLADGVATACVFPAYLLYLCGSAIVSKERAFPGWSQCLSLAPGLTGVYLRRAFYRLVLPRCETGSWIGFGTVFSHATAAIGKHAYAGVYCCLGDVTLEDDVLLGSHVSIMNGNGQHGISRLDVPIREQPGVWPRITIGRDTWIGDRAIVLANVGKHCVVGAGAVVTKDLPDYAIAVGNPARIVRYRNAEPTPATPSTPVATTSETPACVA